MNKNNSLIIKENRLPQRVKKRIIKATKALGYGTMFIGSTMIGIAGITILPIIIIPSIIGTIYGTYKFVNEAIYKTHKDVSFKIKNKINGNRSISQDLFRFDIISKTKDMSLREKVAFLQLQAIVGISKLDKLDRSGNSLTYETLSHSFIRETLKELYEMGIITEYSEKEKKKSRFIAEQLAMGKIKSIKKSKKMYEIKFKLGDQRINFEDPEFQNRFKFIFNEKNGLLAKRKWNIVSQEDGTYCIDYKAPESFMSRIKRGISDDVTSLRISLQNGSPSLAEQSKMADNFRGNIDADSMSIEKSEKKWKIM